MTLKTQVKGPSWQRTWWSSLIKSLYLFSMHSIYVGRGQGRCPQVDWSSWSIKQQNQLVKANSVVSHFLNTLCFWKVGCKWMVNPMLASKLKILCVVLKLKNALDNNCVKHENTQSTTCVLYANWSMNKIPPVHELKDTVMVKFYVSIWLSHRVPRFW